MVAECILEYALGIQEKNSGKADASARGGTPASTRILGGEVF
jgi:hypothetical protein